MIRKIYALIVAGGKSERYGGKVPKQYALLTGKPILYHTLKTFLSHPTIGGIVVVVHQKDKMLYECVLKDFPFVSIAFAGLEREESVLNGLHILKQFNPDYVLIHDAARPWVSHAVINRVIDGLEDKKKAVVPVVPITDTVKKINGKGGIDKTINRNLLIRAQTPQGFFFDTVYALHQKYAGRKGLTDDSSLYELEGKEVLCVEGCEGNKKITTMSDLPKTVKTATGFDVHPLRFGCGLNLFGYFIKCPYVLVGHSDADVGLHAITDALLGTMALGDIGDHFPSTEDRFKNIDSKYFLEFAKKELEIRGGQVTHIDATLIGEEPKIGPFRDQMRYSVAQALKIENDQVSIKATTTEKLGFCGRKEGLAVLATVTVII